MTARPRSAAAKVRAFLREAASGELTVREIADRAGLDLLEAWDIMARGVEAGRLKVRDENRRHQWIEVLDPEGGAS